MDGRKLKRRWMRRWKEGWTGPDAPPGRRRRNAWIDMMLFDHGLFRRIWRNFHRVSEGAWRSSQPDPPMIARLAKRGFRAVLNLRGETLWGSYILEREACAAHGLELIDIKMQSRRLPDICEVRQIDEIFASIPQPFLMHCKSGADRSGFAAALYLLLRTDTPVTEARKQLSVRYLHFKRSKAGILDFMLDAYENAAVRRPMTFREWVYSEYDPDALLAQFQSNEAADFLVDHVLGRE
jgi:protein tyrosine/serine phosphatase